MDTLLSVVVAVAGECCRKMGKTLAEALMACAARAEDADADADADGAECMSAGGWYISSLKVADLPSPCLLL